MCRIEENKCEEFELQTRIHGGGECREVRSV